MINITLEINPHQPMPVKILRDTAKYLLALSGASVVQEIEDGEELTEVKKVHQELRETVGRPSAPSVTSNEEVDIDGKPWDYRFHSSKKTKTMDGRWKLKRNVEQVGTMTEQAMVQAGMIPAAPVVPPPPALPIPAAHPEDLLAKFMGKVTEKIVSGQMTHQILGAFLKEHGIPDVPSIQNYPHLLPELIKKIGA